MQTVQAAMPKISSAKAVMLRLFTSSTDPWKGQTYRLTKYYKIKNAHGTSTFFRQKALGIF